MDGPTSLGARLQHLRNDIDKSQQEVADAVGISRGYLAGLENDHDKPGRETVNALATYFKVSGDWLNTGEGDPRPTALQERTARLVEIFEALPERDQSILEGLAQSLSDRK